MLEEAKIILEDLQTYKGAGEEIRQVRRTYKRLNIQKPGWKAEKEAENQV